MYEEMAEEIKLKILWYIKKSILQVNQHKINETSYN